VSSQQRLAGRRQLPQKTDPDADRLIVQKAAKHRYPSTTELYDQYGYIPKKAESFFATY
jgi:hypothetical protein